MTTPDLLETIAQSLLEELHTPGDYQLTLTTNTMIRLSRPRPLPYFYIFYIEIEPDHILIVEWGQEDTTIPYANPRLVEQIQQIIDDHIARTEADYNRYNNRVTR